MTNKASQVNFDEMNIETSYRSDCQNFTKYNDGQENYIFKVANKRKEFYN